ncbi:MAG: PadR family transcriptional regulator [Christensenellales bacterium]
MENQVKNELQNSNFFILKALENGEKYGYEIIEMVKQLSNNKLEIKQATLYTNLKKLEQKKYINSYWKDSEIGGKRHYYYITDNGLKYLKELDINFTTPKEIIKDEPAKEKNVEIIDSKTINNNAKAYWSENKYFAPKTFNSNDNNANGEVLKVNQNNTAQGEQIVSNKKIMDINLCDNKEMQKNEKKCDAVILSQEETISSSYAAISMENRPINGVNNNTDIDYKNILGELYSNKETFATKNETQNIECVNNLNTQPIDNENVFKNDEINKEPKKDNKQIKLNRIVNNFSNYKIKVKSHNKLYQVNINSGEYIKTNKLRFVLSIINFAFFAVLVILAGLLLNDLNIPNNSTVLGVCVGVASVYPITMLIVYLINKNKRARNNFNFKNIILLIILLCLVSMIFIISICFLCGMTNMNQAKYIYFWFIPVLISITLITYPIIKNLLIKSKKFNC